jgi:hypothetical protein
MKLLMLALQILLILFLGGCRTEFPLDDLRHASALAHEVRQGTIKSYAELSAFSRFSCTFVAVRNSTCSLDSVCPAPPVPTLELNLICAITDYVTEYAAVLMAPGRNRFSFYQAHRELRRLLNGPQVPEAAATMKKQVDYWKTPSKVDFYLLLNQARVVVHSLAASARTKNLGLLKKEEEGFGSFSNKCGPPAPDEFTALRIYRAIEFSEMLVRRGNARDELDSLTALLGDLANTFCLTE